MRIGSLRNAALLALCLARVLVAQSLDLKIQAVDADVEKTRVLWNVPGLAVTVIKDDKALLAKGCGLPELGKPDKVDENTLFAIASNSKAFTTATQAMLVDEKKLTWDDKVSQYIPELQMYDRGFPVLRTGPEAGEVGTGTLGGPKGSFPASAKGANCHGIVYTDGPTHRV